MADLALGHPDWLICQPTEMKEKGWLLCPLIFPQGNNLKLFSSATICEKYQLPEDLKEVRPISSLRFDWSCLIGLIERLIKLFLTRLLWKKYQVVLCFSETDSKEKIRNLYHFSSFFIYTILNLSYLIIHYMLGYRNALVEGIYFCKTGY